MRRRKRLRCSFHAEGRGSVMPVLSPVRGWHGLVSVDLSSVGIAVVLNVVSVGTVRLKLQRGRAASACRG